MLWFVGIGLLVVAFARNRRRSRATLARWAREEAQPPPVHVAVIAPGVRSATPPARAASLAVGEAAEPAHGAPHASPAERDALSPSESDGDEVPKIVLDGERYTIH
jgi:hypothetical protein